MDDAKPTAKPAKTTVADPLHPVDAGWAWVVLVSVFLEQFVILGFYGGVAIYVPVWMEFFESSAAETSFILSLSSFCMGLSSLVAGVLITRFGVRAVWMAGGVITTIGLLISALATSTLYLVFSLGIFTSFGFSMCFNGGFVALSQFFNKRLTFAVGIGSAGFGAGQLALSPLFNYLIDEYGWRGSFVIIAGIAMHLIAAGALVRPFSSKKKRQGNGETPRSGSMVAVERFQETRSQHEAGQPKANVEIADTVLASSLEYDSVKVCYDDKAILWSRNDDSVAEEIPSGENASKEPVNVPRPNAVQRVRDLTPNDHYIVLSSPTDISHEMMNNQTLPNPNSKSLLCNRWKLNISRLKTFILDQYGLSGIFHNPSFILIIPIGVAHGFGWASVVFHLDARAESVGLLPTEGATLLAIMGGGGLAASVSHGWFIDKGYISTEVAYILAILGNALVAFILPPLVTFGSMAAASVLFGMTTGVGEPVFLVMTQNVVKKSEVAGATSICLLCWGIGEIIGATLSGWIYDTFQSYNTAYYVAGTAFVIAAIFASGIYILEKRKKMGKNKLVNETDNTGSEVHRTVYVNEVNRTVEDEARHENGVVNPVYIANLSNEELTGQKLDSQGPSVTEPEQGLTKPDKGKSESNC